MKGLSNLFGIKCLGVVFPLMALATGLSASEARVNLGSAARFAVLGGSKVTNTPVLGTIVRGNVGVSPNTEVTGFPPGVVIGAIHAGDPEAAQAQADLAVAYDDAAGRSSTSVVTLSGDIGGMTLKPGLYKSTSSLAISSDDLVLDGLGDPNAVFIFQIASTLTTSAGRQVLLIGCAQSANVFWQVGSSATFGTASLFHGNILAGASITFRTGGVLNGRALSQSGAVTLESNGIVSNPATKFSRWSHDLKVGTASRRGQISSVGVSVWKTSGAYDPRKAAMLASLRFRANPFRKSRASCLMVRCCKRRDLRKSVTAGASARSSQKRLSSRRERSFS